MSRRSSRNTSSWSAEPSNGNEMNDYYGSTDNCSTEDVSKSNNKLLSYDEVMNNGVSSNEPVNALSARLASFRTWLMNDAGCTLHPSICIVNGEATDGTKNAPVLTYGGPSQGSLGSSSNSNLSVGRCGVIDKQGDRILYERTIGCQVRAARELKKGEIIFSIPRNAMITPDLVAKSDAGMAVLACVEGYQNIKKGEYWDSFLHSGTGLKRMSDRVNLSNATQLLVKILRERKIAENTLAKALKEVEGKQTHVKLCGKGKISTRAIFIAFLIHQRFSDGIAPPVNSCDEIGGEQIEDIMQLSTLKHPKSFGSYARTLPSSASLPICWKRNELALLSACVSGLATLQEVAAQTCLLSADFCALVEAGILHRFPKIFPKGLITWDRWMWAAAIYMSRCFPVSLYLNKGQNRADLDPDGPKPTDVWDDLGVMVPLLDMLNHEEDSSQIQWEQTTLSKEDLDQNEYNKEETTLDEKQTKNPHIILQKRVKKGCQVYNVYASCNNQELITQYGFALMSNTADHVTIGFGLMDGVGKVAKPYHYDEKDLLLSKTVISNSKGKNNDDEDESARHIFENTDDDNYLVFSGESNSVNKWWNNDRLRLLAKLPNFSEALISTLKLGKKLSCTAYNNGTFDKILLSTAIIATMPRIDVSKNILEPENNILPLTKRHQRVLRRFLLFYFSQKLEKLLSNLNHGLKDHFNYMQLWHKLARGGLFYKGDDGCMSWQSFFDTYAYNATMEVEKHYYAMGPDSCVLTLYDGHLRAIQSSIESLLSTESYEKSVLSQITSLGFVLGDEEGEDDVEEDIVVKENNTSSETENGKKKVNGNTKSNIKEKKNDTQDSSKGKKNDSAGHTKNSEKNTQNNSQRKNSENKSGRDRIRRTRKGARPPAIKLHVGNLSYATKPGELFDFFVNKYGRDNVLECHIPTERDTGKSRGFGFVTMPEAAALQALTSGKVHEIEGRVLKVAQSNTAGSGKGSRNSNNPVAAANDRCNKCGYRPRYCDCGSPSLPVHMGHQMDDMRNRGLPHPMPPPQDFGGPYGRHSFDPNIYGGRGDGGWQRGQNWNMERRHSRSRSPSLRGGRGGRMDEINFYHSYSSDRRSYDRGYRDYRGRSYSRSRSRSFSRERDRSKDRSRRSRSGGRRSGRSSGSGYHRRYSGSRSVSRSRSRTRSRSRSRTRSRSRSRSRSYGKGPRRGDESERKASVTDSLDRNRSRSRSRSDLSTSKSSGEKKRDCKTHIRSRTRSRSRGRGRRKRKGSSGRKESSKRYNRGRNGGHTPSNSRSRSRSWSKS